MSNDNPSETPFDYKKTQENIDIAVKAFRETLEKMYIEQNKNLYGIGLHRLTTFFSGKVNLERKKDGSLRISGDIPSIAIKKDVKGLPNKNSDFAIFPVVVTLFQEDVGDKK